MTRTRNCWKDLRWNDQQYLLPFAWNTTLIYYNKVSSGKRRFARTAARLVLG